MISRRTWFSATLVGIIGFSSIAAHAQLVTAIAANTPPNRWATQAFCLSAVYKGLATANPKQAPWQTSNDLQKNFLTIYAPATHDLTATDKNVHAIATSDSSALRRFFAHHGFPGMNISVQGKAVGTVFDVKVTWANPGEKTLVRSTATGEFVRYKAAQINHGVTVYRVGSNYPLFKLATNQSG